jgi:hypothetical protein
LPDRAVVVTDVTAIDRLHACREEPDRRRVAEVRPAVVVELDRLDEGPFLDARVTEDSRTPPPANQPRQRVHLWRETVGDRERHFRDVS